MSDMRSVSHLASENVEVGSLASLCVSEALTIGEVFARGGSASSVA